MAHLRRGDRCLQILKPRTVLARSPGLLAFSGQVRMGSFPRSDTSSAAGPGLHSQPPIGRASTLAGRVATGTRWQLVALRVCTEPGCPEFVKSGRCEDHRRQRDRARGTRQERGYDTEYDRLRKAYVKRMEAGERFHCWRCRTRIDPARWHLGHDDHDRSIIRGPECPACNLATAGRISPDA